MLSFFDKAWIAAIMAPLSAWAATKIGVEQGVVSQVIVAAATALAVYIMPNKA